MYMASRRLSVAELRKDLAQVLRQVEQGREVAVTRSGRLVARLVPATAAREDLSSAGVHPPQRPGPIRWVKPLTTRLSRSLTRTVLEERD
jgi:prevent-host-death family protein